MSSIAWKPNGQKCLLTHVKNGNGSWIEYTPDGFEIYQISIKDGKPDKKLRVNGQFTRHPTWNDFTQNRTITTRWSEKKFLLINLMTNLWAFISQQVGADHVSHLTKC